MNDFKSTHASNPVVTVLMPVYNAKMYLNEAIDSILNQTLTNFEFLIIDDGSTDNSAEIVRSYNDTRIRFIQNEKNLGITPTLNKGVTLSSCELIARMDADDISYPHRLEKQYLYFKNNPDSVLLSNAVRYISADKKKAENVYFNNDFIYYYLIFTCLINTPVTMYKRSIILKEGGYITKYAEDFNLWWRITRKYKYYHDNEILLDYRLSDTSLWKVTKKDEYDRAEYEQTLSNIRYYTGDTLNFNYDEVDFLRKNPKHLIKTKDLSFFRDCFIKIDRLNEFVFDKEKGNDEIDNIKRAAEEKKRERIKKLRKYMPAKKVLTLLIQLKYWKFLFDELKSLKNKLFRRFKKIL